jgi:addiction module HigA family antidote
VDILNGKGSIIADTALGLAQYFRNSAQFWMNLQTHYDLSVAEQEQRAEINSCVVPAAL